MTRRLLVGMSAILSAASRHLYSHKQLCMSQMHTLFISPPWGRELDLHHLNDKTYRSFIAVQPMPCEPRHPFARGRQETKL
jgi:hypothetical protein